MLRILAKIQRIGIVTEEVPAAGEPALEEIGEQLRARIGELFGGSLAIREVDAGSCNGCELEIHALANPYYGIERFGVHFVASPRHADMLLVTGPVSRHMEAALRRTYAATPEPQARDRRRRLRGARRGIRDQLRLVRRRLERDPRRCRDPGLPADSAGRSCAESSRRSARGPRSRLQPLHATTTATSSRLVRMRPMPRVRAATSSYQ